MSKLENKIENCLLTSLYGLKSRHYVNYRLDLLKNQSTGKNLEIDFIIFPKKGGGTFKSKFHIRPILGIEVQGDHHFYNISGFKSDLYNVQERDVWKYEVCKKEGIFLIELLAAEITNSQDLRQLIYEKCLGLGWKAVAVYLYHFEPDLTVNQIKEVASKHKK